MTPIYGNRYKSIKAMKKLLLLGLLLLTTFSIAAANPQPLPVDAAFALSAQLLDKDTIILQWTMAPKHYLYRDRLHFKVLEPSHAEIGKIIFPTGQFKQDEIFGKYEVYADKLAIPVPVYHADLNHTVVEVNYQGCSADGYCYPPTSRQLQVNFNKNNLAIINATPAKSTDATATINPQEQPFFDLLSDHHLATLLCAFFGFGILLSLTPCVLPMIPILSGIIVGKQKTALHGKTFRLSVVYVLSMATTYAVAGMLVGWLGGSVQAVFQKPWVIIAFSLLFILLALSFFGLYSLKLPTRFEECINNISRHQKSGHYLGVAVMGCLATLIVSPCVTPALVGVLSYISKTGNAALGGFALFTMGLGMGVPLLILGFAGGKLLPKAGAWMQTMEYLFGVLFLAIAIWMLDRLLPPPLTLMLWSALLIICAVYLGALSATPTGGFGKLQKGCGLVLLVYGFLLAMSATQGNHLLQPWAHTNAATQSSTVFFTPVKTLTDVEAALVSAKSSKKMLLLDFYADWCISCKEMEKETFQNKAVMAALKNFIVLRADVTKGDIADKQLLQHFQVIAPPTFLIFNSQGQPIKNLTRVGQMDATEFLKYLKIALFSVSTYSEGNTKPPYLQISQQVHNDILTTT
jgi:thiol:disulfide interchange protein DsbD